MSKSIRSVAISMVMAMLFTSCMDKQKVMTQTEIKAKADSLIELKARELRTQWVEDLDRRAAIEVKPKIDSIVQAWQASQPKDTATVPQ